jgi:hypothetical protein
MSDDTVTVIFPIGLFDFVKKRVGDKFSDAEIVLMTLDLLDACENPSQESDKILEDFVKLFEAKR